MNGKLKLWLAVGASEIILSLLLIAIAPTFLNSKRPVFGFLIWFAVPTVIASSGVYVVVKLRSAKKSRQIFITAFPEYSYLTTADFLDISPHRVASQVNLLSSIRETEAIEEFDISLFEILEQTKNEKN